MLTSGISLTCNVAIVMATKLGLNRLWETYFEQTFIPPS